MRICTLAFSHLCCGEFRCFMAARTKENTEEHLLRESFRDNTCHINEYHAHSFCSSLFVFLLSFVLLFASSLSCTRPYYSNCFATNPSPLQQLSCSLSLSLSSFWCCTLSSSCTFCKFLLLCNSRTHTTSLTPSLSLFSFYPQKLCAAGQLIIFLLSFKEDADIRHSRQVLCPFQMTTGDKAFQGHPRST